MASSNDSALLQQIVDILQTSTIAEERGKDESSKFWAAYKKVSSEYDNDMLERCNGNMDIVLIFAGLFSAANTAFIIAMQPNPVDTTNALVFQLIQITLYGSSAAQPNLSPSTSYSPSNVWTQALAYASLAFSLVAAFGAMLGKQWLGYYKTERYGRGSLKARCKQRHRKFLGLKAWRFEDVLQLFPVLLQISLFLFGLSLGAAMWTQQQIISILIIATTACGALCHACTILVALNSPDCPFQTPVSLAIRAVFRHFCPSAGRREDDELDEGSNASAMQWILETSTNPDVIVSVVDLMLTMPRWPTVDLTLACELVGDMFEACFGGQVVDKDRALVLGRAMINIFWDRPGVNDLLRRKIPGEWIHWRSWRNIYLPWALEQCHISFRRMTEADDTHPRHQADTRTALYRAVAAGRDGFSSPDPETYVDLVWNGQFGLELDLPGIDWLVDCARQFNITNDFDEAGYALLLLGGVQKESSFLSQTSLAPLLNSSHQSNHQSHKLRHSALRAACRAHDYKNNSPCDPTFSKAVLMAICPPIPSGHNIDDFLIANAIQLLNFTEWPKDDDLAGSPLLDIQRLVLLALPVPKLDDPAKYTSYCHALIRFMRTDRRDDSKRTALRIACGLRQDLTAGYGWLKAQVISELSSALLTIVPYGFDVDDDFHYLRLIFVLSTSVDWLPHLLEDGHIDRCIRILLDFCDQPPCLFYLFGIFIRAPQLAAQSITTRKQWWDLMRKAWHAAGGLSDVHHNSDVLDDGIEILKVLVRGTEMHMPQDATINELEILRRGLSGTLDKLALRETPENESIESAVRGLKDMVDRKLNAE